MMTERSRWRAIGGEFEASGCRLSPEAAGTGTTVGAPAIDTSNAGCWRAVTCDVLRELPCSDVAQQASACAWLTAVLCAAGSVWSLCIGQSLSSWQQSIRASGVECHPAQRRTSPATAAAMTVRTMMWRSAARTWLGCERRGVMSTFRPQPPADSRMLDFAMLATLVVAAAIGYAHPEQLVDTAWV